jgi:streptomycin 6-kinase
VSVVITCRLRESAADLGEVGARWLEDLPARVQALAEAWALTVAEALPSEGCTAWVAPAQRADGSEAVLKIGLPFPETRFEAEAMRLFDGRGAARVLELSEDGRAMLLERCLPGTDLWSLGEEEGNAVGAALLRWLWRELPAGAPFDRMPERVESWGEWLDRKGAAAGYDTEMMEQAMAIARRLAASQPAEVLVHGDFHPGNVLAAHREPWLAIDPQPLVGDPAYDIAQWLGNRCEAAQKSADPVAALRWQAEQMSALLDLDPDRVARWAFAKSVGQDFGPEDARLLCGLAGA